MGIIIDADGNVLSSYGVTIDDYIALKSKRNKHGCLLWYGKVNKQGYPELTKSQAAKTGFWLVYHYTWAQANGRRCAPDMTLDHTCEVRNCIEPSHLEEVTLRENLMRGDTLAAKNAAKTHCPKGHPYDTVNVNGDRGCKTCQAEATRRYYYRKRARRE